jgi:hypothetical protein
MRMKTIITLLFLVSSICFANTTSMEKFREGLGEFPIGDVYFVNPDQDPKTVEVRLEVDLSQVYLKNKFVHVVEEVQSVRHQEIYAPTSSPLQATVFYHADYAYKFMVRNGFILFGEQIKLILSRIKTEPLLLKPQRLNLIFGKGGLKSHALDADIIYSSVARLLIMHSMGISSDKDLSSEERAILFGMSYFLAAAMNHRPTENLMESSVFRRGPISKPLPKDNNENLSLGLARVLWGISLDSSIPIVNRLIAETTYYMDQLHSINFFIYNLIQSDIGIYRGVHSELIYTKFDEAGMVKK